MRERFRIAGDGQFRDRRRGKFWVVSAGSVTLFWSRDVVVEYGFEEPLVDVGAEHAADGFGAGETAGGLDELAAEVLAVTDRKSVV